MSPLRVAFVITGLHGGGAETMLLRLLGALDRARFSPSVISLMDEGRLAPDLAALGVPVSTAGLRARRPSPGALFRLRALLRAARPHLIQGWMYHGNLAAQLGRLGLRVPVCWCIQHSFSRFADEKPLTRATIRLGAWLSRLAARVVYVSHAARAQHERLGYLPARGCVIPNGVDPTVFRPSPEARASVRAELGLAPETPLIGLIGRYHPQKDHATFLQAAALLPTGAHFLLAGAGVDPGNPALAGHGPRVHLLGERTDMPRLTAALDLATSSSCFGEALSLALTEAMSCEVPCIVTDVGDSARLVGETGAVVPPRDPKALAEAWSTLLTAGDPHRRRLGARARRRIEQDYSVGSIARRYEDLYTTLAQAA